MRNKKSLFIIIIILLLGLLGRWYWQSEVNPPVTTSKAHSVVLTQSPKPKSAAVVNLTLAQPSARARYIPVTLPLIPDTVYTALSPDEQVDADTIQQALDQENLQSINYYGKVVDQHGQPVAGAKVRGNVLLNLTMDASSSKDYYTTTDASGEFKFIGLNGAKFGVEPSKNGYAYTPDQKTNWNKNYRPDPNNPVVYVMYKLQGAEGMVHLPLVSTYVQCDGTPLTFNLLTGKKNDPVKDMTITFVRNPLNIQPRTPFDWTLTLQIPGGGFAEITGPYPNEAPESGYASTITIQHTADEKDWPRNFSGSYYFKARNGQVYGRIKFTFGADYQPPPTGLEFEIYANPSGSRNLEFDDTKQVK